MNHNKTGGVQLRQRPYRRRNRQQAQQAPLAAHPEEAGEENTEQEQLGNSASGLFTPQNTEKMRLQNSQGRQATKRKFGSVKGNYQSQLAKIPEEETSSAVRPF